MKNYTLFLFLLLASQLAAQPTADGLVCWFPFNGNANDESPNGHNGAVAGPVLTNDRHGNPNSAYHFDGVDDFIQVPDQADLRLGNTSFTISTWIRPDDINDLQSHSVLSKRTGSGNLGFLFQLIGTEHIMGLGEGTFDIVTSGGWDDPKLTTVSQLSPLAWHHVFYCYDSVTGIGQFFIDNIPDIQGPMINANGDAIGDLFIGKDNLTDGVEYPSIAPDYKGGYHFFGALDDIRIYNRKLNRHERDELFKEGITETQEASKNIAIDIHPSPVDQRLYIFTESSVIQSIDIYDSVGRIIYQSFFTTEVDCTPMASGTYLISFFDKNGQLIKAEKFVKS